MIYRQYYSQSQWDEIVNNYSDPTTPPHCNQQVFHRPGECPFCDGYYKANPGFRPPFYAANDANGWGGNAAPVLDNAKAAQEEAEWQRILDELGLPPDPIIDQIDRVQIREKVRQIVARFTKGKS